MRGSKAKQIRKVAQIWKDEVHSTKWVKWAKKYFKNKSINAWIWAAMLKRFRELNQDSKE